MNKILTLEQIVDLKDFPFGDIFNNADLWEPVKNLPEFIKSLFEKGIIKPNFKDLNNVYLGEGTIVKKGAFIEGPAVIGNNCIIGHASLIRENCLLGNNVSIGHASEIKNSIFLNSSSSAHLNYVGDSIIGNNVNLSGGVIIANVRLDKKTIRLKVENETIDTQLLKFGSIIGDNSNIGANSVLNPGTILGKNTAVYPLCSVTGVHGDNETIKGIV
jgi:UDP-N-acetylglucosamine diphosphorylase / glucose-1-phosphate thymidylyltransferase / UDP-N-acetylgalactosamine diphosphorylase / glucosamine-1-phosphate N-acetyltransferase / galactosamine-1-phosphate N-acetyltransferase